MQEDEMLSLVEHGLMAAIEAQEAFCRYGYAYVPASREVRLHGAVIACHDGPQGPGWWATCAGWNTARTRQAINALSRHVVGRSVLYCQEGKLIVDDTVIDRWTWFPIQTKQSPH